MSSTFYIYVYANIVPTPILKCQHYGFSVQVFKKKSKTIMVSFCTFKFFAMLRKFQRKRLSLLGIPRTQLMDNSLNATFERRLINKKSLSFLTI